MVDLTKFSKEDLKKTAAEINTYLKKVDEKDYDPNQSTDDAAHLEDKLGGTSKKIEDKGETQKAIASHSTYNLDSSSDTQEEREKKKREGETKKDFPSGNGDEDMTAPSQGDMQTQILAMLKEILGKLSAPPASPMPPAPTDQIQHSVVPTAPVATPATTSPTITDTKVPEKGDININVTKSQIEEVLKSMGITPSGVTQKPKQDIGHPIEKSTSMTYEKIKKMSWDELYNYDQETNPRTF